MINKFFKKQKSIKLKNILENLKLKNNYNNTNINDIKDLENATKDDISFLNSTKYLAELNNTKAKYVIVTEKHKHLIPKKIKPLAVRNVLVSVSKIVLMFYPDSLNDIFDKNLKNIKSLNFKSIIFGDNVLVGKNVKIGKNTVIGHNSIIESNVVIGSNSEIGNNVIIKNTILGNNVRILDGAIIGKKGFGFFPDKKNIRYPHIGMVLIGNNVEIGCNNTIDRGSLSNTVIGQNTFIDNQVHIAHNVKIGKNCIITGQVGFAGSSIIGNNVQIGGQAGISGHLKIGNNVQIGGGSGVVKNIPDNTKVMGYPARDIRKFLRENN